LRVAALLAVETQARKSEHRQGDVAASAMTQSFRLCQRRGQLNILPINVSRPIKRAALLLPSIISLVRAVSYPHLLYPQFKQVWHPSISTRACVLHLAQRVAPGGKPVEDSAAAVSVVAAAAFLPFVTAS